MPPINFEGAGILLATQDSSGEWHVLLGKRLFGRFSKGYYSIPGGTREGREKTGLFGLRYMEYEPESPLETAKREFQEETRLWNGASRIPEDLILVYRKRFPYRWSTYLWVIENPELKPVSLGSHREFEKLSWYPLSNLPSPLHGGMKEAISGALKRIHGGKTK